MYEYEFDAKNLSCYFKVQISLHQLSARFTRLRKLNNHTTATQKQTIELRITNNISVI